MDLNGLLLKKGEDVTTLSRVKGFRYPTSVDGIVTEPWDHVWVTIGAGSVDEAIKDYTAFSDLHVRLVMELAQKLPSQIKLHVFSSDYVANESEPGDPKIAVEAPLSLYAYSKLHMEQLLLKQNRPNTYIYRVGSLYGIRKPKNCFPYKLLKNNPDPCSLTIPLNKVTPTSTRWLATILLENYKHLPAKKTVVYHVAPKGNTHLHEWAQLILGKGYDVVPGGEDPNRPRVSELGCTLPDPYRFEETWKTLWDESWEENVKIWKKHLSQSGLSPSHRAR